METQPMRSFGAFRWSSRFGALLVLAAACCASGCATHQGESPELRHAREKIDFADRFIMAGNYEEAQKMLEESIRLDPRNPTAHYYMGITRFYMGEYPQAEKDLRESLRLKEKNPDAHNALGLVYNQLGDHERALAEYKLALADPAFRGPERALLNMALCQDAMGRTDEAIATLRSAVEKSPQYYAAHYELAKLLDRQDQLRDAIDEYEVAAPDFSADPTYHYRLGLAYFRDHNPEKAREHLTKVTAALPGSEKAAKAKEILALIDAAPGAAPAGPGPDRR